MGMTDTTPILAIDVSKDRLDAFAADHVEVLGFANAAADHSALIRHALAGRYLLVLEATGGYERTLIAACLQAGVPKRGNFRRDSRATLSPCIRTSWPCCWWSSVSGGRTTSVRATRSSVGCRSSRPACRGFMPRSPIQPMAFMSTALVPASSPSSTIISAASPTRRTSCVRGSAPSCATCCCCDGRRRVRRRPRSASCTTRACPTRRKPTIHSKRNGRNIVSPNRLNSINKFADK